MRFVLPLSYHYEKLADKWGTDTQELANRPKTRPPFSEWLAPTIIMAVFSLPHVLCSTAAWVILIVIIAKSFGDLSSGGKACAILYLCIGPLIRVPYLAFYVPVSVLAITISFAAVEGTLRGLSKLEIAFVVLSLIGESFITAGVLVSRWMDQVVYEEWVETFNMSSTDDSERRFAARWNRMFTKIFLE